MEGKGGRKGWKGRVVGKEGCIKDNSKFGWKKEMNESESRMGQE